MKWAILGLPGPLKDVVTPLKSGMTLGRTADLVIEDGKVSSLHARIERNDQDEWILSDNDSKNGTIINAARIARATLALGTIFYIGDQGFQVIEFKEELASKAIRKQRYWYDVLARFLEQHQIHFHNKPRPMAPLSTILVLEFVRGLQIGVRWEIGYGPRKVGPHALDLPLFEPGIEGTCFEILPSPDGVVLQNRQIDVVRINGKRVDSCVLLVGDTIQINDTLIEVDFRS